MTWQDFCDLPECDKALVRERARLEEDIAAMVPNWERAQQRINEIYEQLKEIR